MIKNTDRITQSLISRVKHVCTKYVVKRFPRHSIWSLVSLGTKSHIIWKKFIKIYVFNEEMNNNLKTLSSIWPRGQASLPEDLAKYQPSQFSWERFDIVSNLKHSWLRRTKNSKAKYICLAFFIPLHLASWAIAMQCRFKLQYILSYYVLHKSIDL